MEVSTLVVYADFSAGRLDELLEVSNPASNEYRNLGFDFLHVIACELSSQTEFSRINDNHFLITRQNLGYDFGSWAEAVRYRTFLSEYDFVIFTNSSLAGPLYESKNFFLELLSLECDVKAAVESFQITPHFQTHMWAINAAKLYESGLSDFLFKFVALPPNREETIINGELKLPTVLNDLGLTYKALFPAGSLCRYDQNPTLDAPIRLLTNGFPFIKKALLKTDEDRKQLNSQLDNSILNLDVVLRKFL